MSVRSPLVAEALRAWMQGDLDAFERALAPDVELLWLEPGEWDCHGRDQVMRLLRRRLAEDRPVFEVRIEDVDAQTLVVSPVRPEDRPTSFDGALATRVRLRDGLIVQLQQYRTRAEALSAGD